MSKSLAGTKTEKNLWTAFAGESQARNKYDYFAGVARKEGFQQIAAIFEETAAVSYTQLLLTKKLTPRFGSKNFRASATLLKTSSLLPATNTTNGPTCTRHSLKTPKKKASPNSPLSSAVSAPSKSTTKNVISSS